MNKHKIDLYIFDVDGPILDSFKGTIEAINATLRHFGGREVTPHGFRQSKIRVFENFLRQRGIPANISTEDILAHFRAELDKPERYQEREGIRDVLSHIKLKGKLIHLLSACDEVLTKNKISHHNGLIDFVDSIRGTEQKDEAIIEMCEEAGVSVTNCAFITDMERDLIHGRMAGVALNIGIKSDFCRISTLWEHAHKVVWSPVELLQTLKDHVH